MTSLHRFVLTTAAALCFAAVSTAAQTGGSLRQLSVHASALEGNLLGDPADQEVAVYLPPGYDHDSRSAIRFSICCTASSAE